MMAATKATSRTAAGSDAKGFTPEEKAAARARVKELQAKELGEQDLLDKIEEMNPSDRAMAERIHAIVKRVAPSLMPRTWYGMPAYAKDGGILCFFRPAEKFKTRYATFGFSDKARLDDGTMWPTDFALMKLSAADEKRIADLLQRAISG
jgi:uncharacterized protein YdhG (YjbR/CyaY superfamily)